MRTVLRYCLVYCIRKIREKGAKFKQYFLTPGSMCIPQLPLTHPIHAVIPDFGFYSAVEVNLFSINHTRELLANST
jgi:hypothetical protein